MFAPQWDNWGAGAFLGGRSVRGLQRFPRCHFKDNGQSYFLLKMHCPNKWLVVALDQVEVYIWVL